MVASVCPEASLTHLEQLVHQVARYGLHQPQGAHQRILGVADLAQVVEDVPERGAEAVQLGGGQQLVQREVLHQGVVVVDGGQRLLQT